MGYAEAILSKHSNPVDVHFAILDAIEAKYSGSTTFDPDNYRRQLRVMSQGERAVLLAWNFFDRIHNCGFGGFFLEGGADLAHDTANGYELIGFPKSAEIIRKAADAAGIPRELPHGYDYTSHEETEEQSAALDALGAEYFGLREEKGIEETIAAYVQLHPEEFD